MIDRKLLIRLVFPLVIVAIIGVVLIWPPRLEDLIYNLIVEIVSILITVLFVDWIIKTREGEKWKQVDVLIRSHFGAWSMKFIAEITMFLSEGGWTPPESAKLRSPNKAWGFALEHISFEDIHSALIDTYADDREDFITSLEEGLRELLELYSRHLNRLSSEDVRTVLEIEFALQSVINAMSRIDDEEGLLVLADGDVTKVDSMRTKQIEDTANNLKRAISQFIEIFDKFFPVPK